MTTYMFHNACVDYFNTFHEAHKKLIESVCRELGQEDQIEALTKKFLDNGFTKIKSQRDMNAPKRAACSYLLFSNDKRAEIMAENPEMKMGEVSKKLGAMWKTADKKTKQAYILKAEADKERYAEETAEYKRQTQ